MSYHIDILRKEEMDMLYTVADKSNNELCTDYASQEDYMYTKQDLVVLLNRHLEVWEKANNEPGYRERYSLANDANEITQELRTEFNFTINKIEE